MVRYIPPLFEPYKSKIRVYRATSYQSIPAYSEVKVQFNAKTFDGLGEFDETTNFRFTAREAGYYSISVKFYLTSLVVGGFYQISIMKNATSVLSVFSFRPNVTSYSIHFSDIASLDAGDYLEIFAYNGEAAEARIQYEEYLSFLTIHRLS